MGERVAVITGASSGIGRAAARRFVADGWRVVVVARRKDELEALARELGTDVVRPIAADVTDMAVMRSVARTAVEHFGRIDAWINNAGVSAFGAFEEVPPAAYKRVIETNLIGYLHGAWAALPHLRESSGTLVNVGSVNSRVPAPFAGAYVASKFGVLGWSLALRQELRGSGVGVGVVLPASIDTPFFRHAGNWHGRRAKALEPVNHPDRVAAKILACAKRPRRTKVVGRGGGQMLAMHALAPGLFELLFAKRVARNHFLDEPAEPTYGNLLEPMPEGTGERDGWKELARRRKLKLAAVAGAAAAPVAATAVLRRR